MVSIWLIWDNFDLKLTVFFICLLSHFLFPFILEYNRNAMDITDRMATSLKMNDNDDRAAIIDNDELGMDSRLWLLILSENIWL